MITMAKIKLTDRELRKIIAESVRKALNEERSDETDNKIKELISFLHNAQKPVREIHWNTDEYSLHMVTDEAIGDLCEWEDGLAEAFMGDRDIELKIGEKKPSSEHRLPRDPLLPHGSVTAVTLRRNCRKNERLLFFQER